MGSISPNIIPLKNKEKIHIRTANDKDGNAMHLLTKDLLLEEKWLIMTIRDFNMTVKDQQKRNELFLQHPQTVAIVAENEIKQLIGILTIEPEPLLKTAHRGIVGIIIHKNYRSLGVGKKLMEIAVIWAKQNIYYEKLELEVLQSNKYGIALYEKFGFKQEGIIQKAIKHKENNYEDLLKMGLFLT